MLLLSWLLIFLGGVAIGVSGLAALIRWGVATDRLTWKLHDAAHDLPWVGIPPMPSAPAYFERPDDQRPPYQGGPVAP